MTAPDPGTCAGPTPDCATAPVRVRGVAWHTERHACGYCGSHTRWGGWVAQLEAHACPACLWQRWTR